VAVLALVHLHFLISAYLALIFVALAYWRAGTRRSAWPETLTCALVRISVLNNSAGHLEGRVGYALLAVQLAPWLRGAGLRAHAAGAGAHGPGLGPLLGLC
jgi:hypothetical protein